MRSPFVLERGSFFLSTIQLLHRLIYMLYSVSSHKHFFAFFLFIGIFLTACSDDGADSPEETGLTQFEEEVINYFKEIALGFEFGNMEEITRKWNEPMILFAEGEITPELEQELIEVVTEINSLATDGFEIIITEDQLEANYRLFFGSGKDFASRNPAVGDLINTNLGLFFLFWNGDQNLVSGNGAGGTHQNFYQSSSNLNSNLNKMPYTKSE